MKKALKGICAFVLAVIVIYCIVGYVSVPINWIDGKAFPLFFTRLFDLDFDYSTRLPGLDSMMCTHFKVIFRSNFRIILGAAASGLLAALVYNMLRKGGKKDES